MSLAIFDFDRTIVDDDSDATIIRRLREKKPPPEWEQSNYDWTPYMSDVFEHAYSAGLSQEDILECIASMKPAPGLPQLISSLAASGWDLVLITDANSVFVNHWLEEHKLRDCVADVLTNRAWWERGRLYIEPFMRAECRRCPSNLCKSAALSSWCRDRVYQTLAYVGDGRNDYCAVASLPDTATVFPRHGYPLEKLIDKDLSSAAPEMKAKVVPWDDGYQIIKELLPNSNSIIGVNI